MRILIKMAALSRKYSHYLVLLVSAALIASALVFAVLRLSHPSDGARLWLRVQSPMSTAVLVVPVREQPSGLQANDCVVSVAGRAIHEWIQPDVIPSTADQGLALDQTVVYTVIRDGVLLDIPVTLSRYPLAAIA